MTRTGHRFSIKRITIGLMILIFCSFVWAVVSWVKGIRHSNMNPEIGVDQSSVDWLPEEATNVSYFKSYSLTAYEFDITESGFRSWVSSKGRKVEEISKPQKIARYLSYQALRSADNSDPALDESLYAEVSSGLFYYEEYGGGGASHSVYDRQNQRAYHDYAPR